MENKNKGLIIVHTGDGKGKTTAALGMAIRAWGNGMRVLILQFIKGSWTYGELKAVEALRAAQECIEIRQGGLGFTRRGQGASEEHRAAAAALIAMARDEVRSGAWDMVILDEFNYADSFGLVGDEALEQLLAARPESTHLIFTGRNASPKLIDRADLVTEMHLVKHPFQKGIKAQKGIEF